MHLALLVGFVLISISFSFPAGDSPSQNQGNAINSLVQELEKIPRAKVFEGKNNDLVVKVSAEGLYKFLKENGLSLPPISELPGFLASNPKAHKVFTLPVEHIGEILENKDKLINLSASQLSKVIKSPGALSELIGGDSGNGGNGGGGNGEVNISGGGGGNGGGGNGGGGNGEGSINGGAGGNGGGGLDLNSIIKMIGNVPGLKIETTSDGQKGVSTTIEILFKLLGQLGYNLPPISQLPGSPKGSTKVTLPLNIFVALVRNKDKLTSLDPSTLLKIIGNPDLAVKILGNLGVNIDVNGRGGGLDLKKLITLLGQIPGLQVVTTKEGHKAVTSTIGEIYKFFRNIGLDFLPPLSELPGKPNVSGKITIPIDVIIELIINRNKLSTIDPSLFIKILSNPDSGITILKKFGINIDAILDVGAGNGGGRHTKKRRECRRGLVDGLATAIKTTTHNLTQNAFRGIPRNNLLGGILHGVSAIVRHAFSGADFAIQDAACGLGNIADHAARGINHGRILQGVGSIGREFVGGVDSIGEDAVGEAGFGLSRAAKDVFEPLSRPGGGGQKKSNGLLGGLLGALG